MTIQAQDITAKNQLSSSPSLLGDRQSILDGDLLCRHLTEEQSAILKDLIELKATTPLRFEIRTGRIGQNLKQKLDELQTLGLVETRGLTVNTKETIYIPSPGARRFIAAIEKAKRTKKRQFSR
jgi:hypothetical protein